MPVNDTKHAIKMNNNFIKSYFKQFHKREQQCKLAIIECNNISQLLITNEKINCLVVQIRNCYGTK